MEIFFKMLLMVYAVTNLIGPVMLVGALDEDTTTLFIPYDLAILLRQKLSIPGTIIAMVGICLWFSLAVAANIALIVILFLLSVMIGLFFKIFRRRD